jgi:hypothetical protein
LKGVRTLEDKEAGNRTPNDAITELPYKGENLSQ